MQRYFSYAVLAVLCLTFASLSMHAHTVCPDNYETQSVTARSAAFDCCDDLARFNAADEVVKAVQDEIAAMCSDEGADQSAIARICVDFEHLTDGRCRAVATAWYGCFCCVYGVVDVPECSYDDKACDNRYAVDTKTIRAEYPCCNSDRRKDATHDAMEKAYIEVRDYCALLDCLGGLGVRGFQIDYGIVDSSDGTCGVQAKIFYSCCCICE